MDSKQNNIYKVLTTTIFYSGLKVYNLKYISKTIKGDLLSIKDSSNKITCIGLIDNEIIVFDNTILTGSVYRNLR
jgi:hypothetical protein